MHKHTSKSVESASFWQKQSLQRGGSTPKTEKEKAVVKYVSLRHSWIFHTLPLWSSWRGLMQFSCIRVLSLFLPSSHLQQTLRACVVRVRSRDPFPKSSIKNLIQATVLVTVAVNSTPSHQGKKTKLQKMLLQQLSQCIVGSSPGWSLIKQTGYSGRDRFKSTACVIYSS